MNIKVVAIDQYPVVASICSVENVFPPPKCEQNAWAATHHRTTAIVCSVILKDINFVSVPFPLTFRHKACKRHSFNSWILDLEYLQPIGNIQLFGFKMDSRLKFHGLHKTSNFLWQVSIFNPTAYLEIAQRTMRCIPGFPTTITGNHEPLWTKLNSWVSESSKKKKKLELRVSGNSKKM